MFIISMSATESSVKQTSASLNENYKHYLQDVKSLDIEDPDLHSKVNSLSRYHGIVEKVQPSMPQKGVLSMFDQAVKFDKWLDGGAFSNYMESLPKPFDFSHRFNRSVNQLMNEFNSNLDNFKQSNSNNGYSKLESSYIRYDSNGEKKSETLKKVTKKVNGNVTTHQKKIIQNGDEHIEEVTYPDGRVVTTTKTVNKDRMAITN